MLHEVTHPDLATVTYNACKMVLGIGSALDRNGTERGSGNKIAPIICYRFQYAK